MVMNHEHKKNDEHEKKKKKNDDDDEQKKKEDEEWWAGKPQLMLPQTSIIRHWNHDAALSGASQNFLHWEL